MGAPTLILPNLATAIARAAAGRLYRLYFNRVVLSAAANGYYTQETSSDRSITTLYYMLEIFGLAVVVTGI